MWWAKKYHQEIDLYRQFQNYTMPWMFDSHIHLSDPAYENDLEHIIKGMENLQLKACAVSMDNENSKKTLEISKKSDLILPLLEFIQNAQMTI